MHRHQKPYFVALYLMMLGSTCYALAFLLPWWIYGRHIASVKGDLATHSAGHDMVRMVGWFLFSVGVVIYIMHKLRRRRRRTHRRHPIFRGVYPAVAQ
jgi:hypothetical protein